MEDVAKLELVDGFANLLSTGQGSDLVITCNGSTFNVHKAILASRSDFFKTACWGDFKEGQSNRIDLPDDDAGLVKKMIDYFYLLDYESDKDTGLYMVDTDLAAAGELTLDDIEDSTRRVDTVMLRRFFPQYDVRKCFDALTENGLDLKCAYSALALVDRNAKEEEFAEGLIKRNDRQLPIPELAVHTSIYGIADKYGIQGLKGISTQKLKAALQHQAWIPDSQQCYSSNMIDEFAAAVQAAWNLTPESDSGVRAPLLDHAWKIRKVLLGAEGFKLVAQQIPEFTWDLTAQSLKQ